MNKVRYFIILLTLLLATNSFAQLTGTKTIPGDYATIAAAVTDLNSVGVGSGGVTFNVSAGHSETTTSGITLTATGISGNPILFQKSGAGANPIISRTDAGTNTATALGALGDAVIRIDGSDYVTFDGINVTTSDAGIEYGYFTHKPSGTDGCQYLTIKNSTVSMTKGTSGYVAGIYIGNGATSVSSATGVTVTAESGRNAEIVIAGDSIRNVHAGILVRGSSATGFYDNNITVGQQNAGNTITNYGGGSATSTYAVYFIYVNNPAVAYNTINNALGGTPHGSTLYGVFYSTVLGNVTGSNNTITLANSAASSATYYLYSTNGVTSENYSNNTFGAGTLSSTGTVCFIYASNATNNKTISGNQTTGTITRTGASGSFYGYYNLGSPTGGTETLTNNAYSSIVLSGTAGFYGIYSNTNATQARVCSSNTISNITGGSGTSYGLYLLNGLTNLIANNTVRNIAGAGTVFGMTFSGTTPTVYGNLIYNLSTTYTAIYGMADGGTGTTNCYNNKIYNISSSNAAPTVYGLNVSTGTANYVYNNFISDIKAPASTNLASLAGIYVGGGTTVGLYYNSVFLNASSTGATFGSSGIYASSTPTLDMRNNIVVNLSTPSGATGISAAYRRSSSSLTTHSAASNNNLFYAGTPGANNLIMYDGTNSYQTLAAFQAAVTPADGSSITENPAFINSTTAPYDLHVDTTTPTLIEGGAAPVAAPLAITSDFDGDTRSAGSPDIGADEFSGTRPLLPPTVQIAPKSKNFGSVQVGTSASDNQFTVKNSGGGILTVNSVSFLSGSNTVFVKTDTNTYPKNLAGNESLVFNVKFSPADTGSAGALLSVNTAVPTEALDTISLSGYGYDARITSFPYTNSFDAAPFPPLGWSTSATAGTYLFERVTTGSSPTVTPHSGAAMLTYRSFSSPDGNGAILVTPQINLPSSEFRFRIWMYRDSTYSTKNDRIVIYANSSPALTGADSIGGVSRYRGTDPALNGWYEYVFTFPSGFQGNGKHLIVKAISAFGGNMFFDDFTIEQIPSNPTFAISPTEKNFGDLQIGSQSSITAFTVSNSGAGTLTISAPALTGANAAAFALLDTNTYPKELTAGQSLTFGAKFAPADTGAKSASISIAHSSTGSPALVALTGRGVDFTISNFPYYQNFDSIAGVFPPPGWLNTGNYWVRGSEAYSLPYCAKVSYNYSSTVQAMLQTPPINLPAYSKISFYWKDDDITAKRQQNGDALALKSIGNPAPVVAGYDTTFFEISTDGGSTWTTLAFLSAASSQVSYAQQVCNLGAYAGTGRLLRWRDKTDASYNAYGTGLDDIKIEVVPPVVDWYNLQWPLSATVLQGRSVTVYAQAWENGTTPNGADTTIKCWIGYSDTNTDPSAWTNWTSAVFNTASGNNNEYKADIGSTLPAGTYYYASRFQHLSGPYTYGGCSASNGGPWNGTSNVSGVLTVQNPFTVNWEASAATSSLPIWMGTDTERGFVWGRVNTPSEGLVSRIAVVSRKWGSSVKLLDDSTGVLVDSLNVTGITGGTFAINDAEVDHLGRIYACNLTTSTATSPFRVYRWDNTSSLPKLVLSYTGDAVRLGDKLTVAYDSVARGAVIWAASSTTGFPKVYKFYPIGLDSVNQVPAIVTLSDNIIGTTASVGPLYNGDFYWNANGQSARKYRADGTIIDTIPGTIIATGSNAIRYIGKVNGSEFIATFQYGAGNNNVRVVEVPNGDPNIAVTYGISPSLGANANANGTGDVAVKQNFDGSHTVFVLATNNGLGSYKAIQVIPVEFSAFSASVENRDVTLAWTTATETNSASFSVERTVSGKNSWSSVGSVAAAGTSTEMKSYSYLDRGLTSAKYQYRLKQIDLDGTYSCSKIIEVEVNVPLTFELSQNYPNPFNPSTVIRYSVPVEGFVALGVYNLLGERVVTLVNQAVSAGSYEVSFDASALPTGVYIYKMESGSFSSVKKMMLVK